MELKQIKHLVAVAETGSFTKASERVAITQPALSASIAKLEAELEVRLLDRRRSNVTPTPAGLRFLERAGSILLECSTMKAEVRKVALPQPLRIGVLRTLPSSVIADLVRAYRRVTPGAALRLFDGNPAELHKRFQDRKLHALVTIANAATKSSNFRTLFSDRFVLAVPLDHRFARLEGVRLRELNGEPFISRTSCETFALTSKALAERGIKPRITYVTDQNDRALDLVAAGVGLAMVPEIFDAPGVAKIKLLDYDVRRTIGLQWSSELDHEHLNSFIKIASTQAWQTRPT